MRKPKRYSRGRRSFVGASETAALHGLHPNKTYCGLFLEKTGIVPEPDLSGDDRVQAGLKLEPSIARMAANKWGWTIKKARRARHATVPGMAATPDYIGYDSGQLYKQFLVQIKNVDGLVFRNEWEAGPPLHYQLQLQHELACWDGNVGCIVALAGGNELHCYRYERHDRVIAKLEAAVTEFWEWVDRGEIPPWDYAADAGHIAKLYRHVRKGRTIDLSADNRAVALCAEMVSQGEAAKAAKAAQEAARAELLEKMGDAEVALAGDFRVSSAYVDGRHVAFDKPGYRMIRVTEKKHNGQGNSED